MTNETKTYEDIGRRIREERAKTDLSQQDLADAVGFESATAISLIEKGSRKVSIPHLEKIAAVLHTTTVHLLGEQHPSSADTLGTLRYALRADKEITKDDADKVVDFYTFIKSQRAN